MGLSAAVCCRATTAASPATCYLLPAACYLLPATCCLLLAACCLLLAACCLLPLPPAASCCLSLPPAASCCLLLLPVLPPAAVADHLFPFPLLLFGRRSCLRCAMALRRGEGGPPPQISAMSFKSQDNSLA